ncbi:uncharacterized protein Dwil_GK11033 [Drosophila willistoni]|uniref:RING-type domain-containing protein n=1 Tax=Drosophila willistoni TaxID=7260 RepID=B4N8G8_DROWI|nr:E3 ubiquitin-protein ligase FANCL [Drosophila willistoni]EDW81419.1 uncharacterized protein Dwil_GK11033 [Drosophila willistoni]
MDSAEENLKQILANKYPGLVVECGGTNPKSLLIHGVMSSSEGRWLRLKLLVPNYPGLKKFQLYVQHQMEYKCYTSQNLPIQDNWNLEDLLANLWELMPSETSQDVIKVSSRPKSNIYEEILELHKPLDYHLQLNDSCTRIRFSRFAEMDQHFLELELPSLRLLEHSLPDCVPLATMLSKNVRCLRDALQLYQKLLEDLRPFYETFMDIDELCHVLQPSPVTTKDNSRVFPLKERVYLKVIIADPLAYQASMSLQIIGPTEEVAQLRHKLNDGLANWDIELDMHKNLLRVFDLCYFPMPDMSENPKDKGEEHEQEEHCNICFVYRLDNGQVPLVSCDNARCVLKCHAACLKEWFNTLMDGKTFLEVSFGLCPFCKAKLSTSFAALLDD